MKFKHILVVLGFWLLCGAAAAFLVYRMQPMSEAKAARETEVPGLKILAAEDMPERLRARGLYVSYVEAEATPGKYTCGPMTRGQSIRAAAAIDRALADIPDKSLKKTRLKYLLACSYAKSGTINIGGIPVPPLKLLMLDLDKADPHDPRSRHNVLHEFYHYAEYRLAGIRDKAWDSRFKGYAGGYQKDLMRRSDPGDGKKGFLNVYAQTLPQEERAEIFAHLVMDPGALASYLRQSGDTVLQEKILYMIDKTEKLLGLAIDFPRPDSQRD